MPIEDEVLKLIPVGEENAVSARLLWQQLGLWASSSIRSQLNKMAAQGIIETKIECRNVMLAKLYYRTAHPTL
jgi:hypothetical protein